MLLWKSNLPPHLIHLQQLCQSAIRTLDEQAQNLTKTVATWFLEDRRVDDKWMPKSANETPCSNNQLAELDAVVEELAFCCQVFDHYIDLSMQAGQGVVIVKNTTTTTTLTNTIQEMHPEWTWKYASLERYLTHQQLQSALANNSKNATPSFWSKFAKPWRPCCWTCFWIALHPKWFPNDLPIGGVCCCPNKCGPFKII